MFGCWYNFPTFASRFGGREMVKRIKRRRLKGCEIGVFSKLQKVLKLSKNKK